MRGELGKDAVRLGRRGDGNGNHSRVGGGGLVWRGRNRLVAWVQLQGYARKL